MNIQNLGLALRAKKVVIGTDITIKNLRLKRLELIVLATDASNNTKKKIYDKAKTYQVEVLEKATSDEISNAIGKVGIKVLGITDKGFKKLLTE